MRELLWCGSCVGQPRSWRHLARLQGAIQAAWLADVAASGSHKENKVAVRTRIPSFDSPGVSRGCLLGHPCGVFPENILRDWPSVPRHESYSRSCGELLVVPPPFGPMNIRARHPPAIPLTAPTQHSKTNPVLKQGTSYPPK